MYSDKSRKSEVVGEKSGRSNASQYWHYWKIRAGVYDAAAPYTGLSVLGRLPRGQFPDIISPLV